MSSEPKSADGRSRFGRSLCLSGACHVVLLATGLALPVLWVSSGASRPPVSLMWAGATEPTETPAVEPPEPEREVELEPLRGEPELLAIPVEPEPWPEPDLPDPLEAVELLAEALRRPPLEAIFARRAEPVPREAALDPPREAALDPAEAPIARASASPPEEAPADTASDEVVLVPARPLDHCPRPPYPARALRLGWYGTVVCSFVVERDGSVARVLVLESSGHDLLDETVVRTLRTWRFAPATRDGVPTETELVRRFRFELPS